MSYNQNQDFIIKFGQNLRRLRQERKINQEKLSHKTDLALSQIGRIERGEINASLNQVIADALVIEPARLFEFAAIENTIKVDKKSYYS